MFSLTTIFVAGGSSSFPCSETYAGNAPFSDIETKSMSEYIRSISGKFYAYISFHSYSQLLMYPYGYTKVHLKNYKDLVRDFNYKTTYSSCINYDNEIMNYDNE